MLGSQVRQVNQAGQIGQLGRSDRSVRQIRQVSQTGQIGQLGRSDRSVMQVRQVSQAGQKGQLDRSDRSGEAKQLDLAIRQDKEDPQCQVAQIAAGQGMSSRQSVLGLDDLRYERMITVLMRTCLRGRRWRPPQGVPGSGGRSRGPAGNLHNERV